MEYTYKHKFIRFHFSKNPWVNVWHQAKTRCTNPSNPSYKYYGGRGIKFFITKNEIHFLWIRDEAWKMKQPSIDRINTDGHYEISNCRFIEMSDNIAKRNTEYALKLKKNK